MDLPLNHIDRSIFSKDGYVLQLKDNISGKILLAFDPTPELITSGDYVGLVRIGTEKSLIMRITSDYEFETLSRKVLLNATQQKLKEMHIILYELGMFLKDGDLATVGRTTVKPIIVNDELRYQLYHPVA